MGKIIVLNNKINYRYLQRECTIIKNEMLRNYNFIVLSDLEENEFYISEFTDFFLHKDRLNNSINTNKNNYGTIIVLFLNYIFFDRNPRIKDIQDITIEIGNEFFNKYVYGELSQDKNKKNIYIKSDAVIESAETALSHFYKWLFYNKNYKMKFIKKTDFEYKNIRYPNKSSIKKNFYLIERKSLKSLFTVEYPHKPSNIKITSPDELMIFVLIEVAQQYDPMLAFAIALQSFAGLRRGEVCQICKKRISQEGTHDFSIDLRQEYLLRKDGVRTGDIKKPRLQKVYPAFLPYINRLYKEHMQFLSLNKLDMDPYGAIFIGNNKKALTTHRYAQRFSNLMPKLIKRLGTMANNGNKIAAIDFEILTNKKMTPHALRYFFSDYISQFESPHIVAVFRGDSSLDSVLTYLMQSRFTRTRVKEIQNNFINSYEKIMKKTFWEGVPCK